ncbi:MAG: MgtC/SapB family protein, partial [Peptostreptococcaceae bacterium]|nr:MgtC/SapB family protein [Peptostreptococcaceae bacterium]
MALIIGGIIGFEREGIKRPAGFRTHILVCVGSTLIMLCGIHIYNDPRFGPAADPTRLGAQIVSGMGFLGAGTIIRNGSSVKGLTTAAG